MRSAGLKADGSLISRQPLRAQGSTERAVPNGKASTLVINQCQNAEQASLLLGTTARDGSVSSVTTHELLFPSGCSWCLCLIFRRDEEAKNGKFGERFTSVYSESPACLASFPLLFMESCGCCIPSTWGMPGGRPGYCWDAILNKLSSWSEEMDRVSA